MNEVGYESPGWNRTALAIYTPLAALAIGWIGLRGGWPLIRERTIGDQPVMDLLLGLALGLGVVGICRFLTATTSHARRAERTFSEILGPLSPRACGILAVASSVGEETVFRAAMQPELGLVATSLVFGALHAPIHRDLVLWTFFATLMGFLLGWLFQQSGAIPGPVGLHFTVNYLNLRRIAAIASAAEREGAPHDEGGPEQTRGAGELPEEEETP